MLKKVIVIRHGESEKDKTNPKRKLTQKGVSQIVAASKKIKKLVKNPALIICSNTFRTYQTSKILAKNLSLNCAISKSRLRIKEGQTIPLQGIDARNMARRFLRTVNKYDYLDTLIVVGNSGGLEAFINFQTKFVPKKKISRELNYGEFVILRRKL